MEKRIANRRKAVKQILEAILRGQQEEYCQLKNMYEKYRGKKERLGTLKEKYEEFRDIVDDCDIEGETFEDLAQMLQDKNAVLELRDITNYRENIIGRKKFYSTNDFRTIIHESDLFNKLSMDPIDDSLKVRDQLGKVCALYGIAVDEIPEEALFDYGFVMAYLNHATSSKLDRNEPAVSDSVYIEFVENLGKRNTKVFSEFEIGKTVAGRDTSIATKEIAGNNEQQKNGEQK